VTLDSIGSSLSGFLGFPLAAEETVSDSFPWMVETSVWMLANLLNIKQARQVDRYFMLLT
jgi:hypothetical protein